MYCEKNHLGLLTDLYELTMAAAYYRHGMFAPATFSLFIRRYPDHRSYFVSAGLEEVLEYLESLAFTEEELDYLNATTRFSQDFLQYLSTLRFTGNVVALPEGTIFFKNEPILEVTAPLIEAQIVESFIINAVNLPVAIVTKASRCVHAAAGRGCVDFSLRRTQGTDAGMKVARASYIAGFSATSNVLAGWRYGIPLSGTMAHSFVTSFEKEIDAFRAFGETFPDQSVFLIDTYDTLSGACNAVKVAMELAEQGKQLKGVRLDSGDMAALSKQVRALLDEARLTNVEIFSSGNLDEYSIAEMVRNEAKIDAFGIGTKMGVSADGPYTDIAYKLVEYDGRPVLKLSSGKETLVGKKQVFRRRGNGFMQEDTIAFREEKGHGEPLLRHVMINGKRSQAPETLETIRERFREQSTALDQKYKHLESPEVYPVRLSRQLQELQNRVAAETRERINGNE